MNGSSPTYTGAYAFKAGELAFDKDRVWKCVSSAADCKATQPSLDKGETKWQLTTLKGTKKTTAEMEAATPTTQQCYKWTAGYPVMGNDVVCDPAAPTSRSWTCLDAAQCLTVKPDIATEPQTRTVWGLSTKNARVGPDGALSKIAAGITFAPIAAPKEGAAVQCDDWSTLERGTDVGAKLTWCDRGRVYACIE